MDKIEYGIDRKKLDQILIAHGGVVEPVRRTGEVRYRHPMMAKTARADGRRKDAPMHLVKFVHSVIALTKRNAANDDRF